jgi:hypothetical protein
MKFVVAALAVFPTKVGTTNKKAKPYGSELKKI